MLEVEMKFPLTDLVAFQGKLQEVCGSLTPQHLTEVDHYYNPPDREFAQTDEALRVRSCGATNYVTYKGPKLDTVTKTRKEIEVPIGSGAETASQFRDLLEHLRYRFVGTVQKERTQYVFTVDQQAEVVICLDRVQDVGTFVELEICSPVGTLEHSRTRLLNLAAKLNLTQSERRSYLQLLLAKRSSTEPKTPQ